MTVLLVHASGRQYYVLTLHKETPLDQQPDPKAAPPQGVVTPQTTGFDDGFAGFTLKGTCHCCFASKYNHLFGFVAVSWLGRPCGSWTDQICKNRNGLGVFSCQMFVNLSQTLLVM